MTADAGGTKCSLSIISLPTTERTFSIELDIPYIGVDYADLLSIHYVSKAADGRTSLSSITQYSTESRSGDWLVSAGDLYPMNIGILPWLWF